MRDFFLTSAARADINAIWRYIAADNPDAADACMDKFYDAMERISDFPNIGRLRNEFQERPHSLAVDRYVLFYKILSDGKVEFGRFLHGSMDNVKQI